MSPAPTLEPPADNRAEAVADPQRDLRRLMQELAQNQAGPITVALLIAAVIFAGLSVKNALDRYAVIAAVCAVATLITLIYARAFHLRTARPLSDGTLVLIALVIVGIVVSQRGLTGVLWAFPLILFFHLVVDRMPAQVFNAGSILITTALINIQYDGQIAFRVGATLLVGSALVIVYTNILRQQQLHREDQRRRLDLLLRCSSIGGYEWDAEGAAPVFSPRLLEMLGYPAGTPTAGWTLGRLVHEEDRERVEADFARLLAGRGLPGEARQARSMDFRMLRHDGERIWVHVDAIAIAGRQGATQKLIASFLDVTPIKGAEEETRAALRRQEELNELRSRFVAMTSHEFRTPLATILSSAELIRYYGEKLPPEEKDALAGTIDEAVQRMTRMLDRILLISRAEAGMLEFRPQPLDLEEFCRGLADEVRSRHADSTCRLRLDFAGAAGGHHYDGKLLRHVIDNLLSNAVKYSPQGGEVAFRVTVSPAATELVIADQGIGIPAADLPHLFDSFHRGSNVGDIRGTGLGLAIVKAAVDVHGGRIAVDSEPGAGTRFTVTLPAGGTAGDVAPQAS